MNQNKTRYLRIEAQDFKRLLEIVKRELLEEKYWENSPKVEELNKMIEKYEE